MLNPNLACKISYDEILNNSQSEAVNGSGVLRGKTTEGQSRFCFHDMTPFRADFLIEYEISQGEGEK